MAEKLFFPLLHFPQEVNFFPSSLCVTAKRRVSVQQKNNVFFSRLEVHAAFSSSSVSLFSSDLESRAINDEHVPSPATAKV